MKGKPIPERKAAKPWPIKSQNNPTKQHRQNTGHSKLIRQNVNNTPKQHRQYACLSKVESRDLIGRKINKGNSCASVSQKRKQKHAVKCGRHFQKLNPLKKFYKLHKTEVSHTYKTPVKPLILRRRNINSLGHGVSPNRDPNKIKGRLPKSSKVRQQLKANDLKIQVNHRVVKREALSGHNMSRRNEKSENSDEERERNKKQHKDLKKRSKNSGEAKLWDVDPVAFSREIEQAFTSIKNRESNKPLSREEALKHMEAINASISDNRTRRRPKKKSSKVPEMAKPEGQENRVPEGTAGNGTRKTVRARNKRKGAKSR